MGARAQMGPSKDEMKEELSPKHDEEEDLFILIRRKGQ